MIGAKVVIYADRHYLGAVAERQAVIHVKGLGAIAGLQDRAVPSGRDPGRAARGAGNNGPVSTATRRSPARWRGRGGWPGPGSICWRCWSWRSVSAGWGTSRRWLTCLAVVVEHVRRDLGLAEGTAAVYASTRTAERHRDMVRQRLGVVGVKVTTDPPAPV